MNTHPYGITDLNVYLHRMQKSILDKMFFMDKIFEPVDHILDFGCANGELIKALHAFFGEYHYAGYDLSEEMIEAARINMPEGTFYLDWDEIHIPFERSLLNISSTIHEVYSYGTEESVAQFWQRVFGSGFRYVTIRDMMFSDLHNTPVSPSELAAVRSNPEFRQHLADYEQIWGPITRNRDLVHYLLKYSYTQNWDREVRENYFSLSLERFLSLIPNDYEITYYDSFTLPYTAWQIRRDFGLELKTPTHIKIILKKREQNA